MRFVRDDQIEKIPGELPPPLHETGLATGAPGFGQGAEAGDVNALLPRPTEDIGPALGTGDDIAAPGGREELAQARCVPRRDPGLLDKPLQVAAVLLLTRSARVR